MTGLRSAVLYSTTRNTAARVRGLGGYNQTRAYPQRSVQGAGQQEAFVLGRDAAEEWRARLVFTIQAATPTLARETVNDTVTAFLDHDTLILEWGGGEEGEYTEYLKYQGVRAARVRPAGARAREWTATLDLVLEEPVIADVLRRADAAAIQTADGYSILVTRGVPSTAGLLSSRILTADNRFLVTAAGAFLVLGSGVAPQSATPQSVLLTADGKTITTAAGDPLRVL